MHAFPEIVSSLRLCQLQVVFHEALELCHAETEIILGMNWLIRRLWIKTSPGALLFPPLSALLVR